MLIQDLKISLRQGWRRPMFTLTAVLTLAVGMGVNTVAFTVVNGVLFKRPPIVTTDGVGRIETTPGSDEGASASLEEYQRFVAATEGALDVAAEGRLTMTLHHEGRAQPAWVLFVSSSYFSLIDVRPVAGRVDVMRAAGGPPSVVIGERFWRRTLNAPSLAGLTLHLNDVTVNVAGVLPEAFRGPGGLYSPDVWLPLDDVVTFNTARGLQNRSARWLYVFGRMRSGVTAPQIQSRLDAATAAMAQEWPDTHRGRGARFRLMSDANSEIRGLRTGAALAMSIIGLVLLLACFNVANLLLARAVERERDMAVRAAIGASGTRLIRLVVTEGFLIALLAGAAALVLAWWTQTLVGSFAIPIDVPQHIDLAPDAGVVGFVLVLIVIAGVLPGLWPAIKAARVNVLHVLTSQGGPSASGRPSVMRRWLVAAQIGGSTAFLALAALIAQSYGHRSAVDLGFDRERLVVADLSPAAQGYDTAASRRYVETLLARVRALPGVTGVAAADRVPFFIGFERLTPVSSPASRCEAETCPQYATMAIGPDYFETMGIALAAGRSFTSFTARGEVVINQPLALILWPDGGGIGKALLIGSEQTPVTVVGITAKTLTRGLDRERPTLYVPFGDKDFDGGLSIVAHTAGAPEAMLRPFADAAHAVDPHVALQSLKTMDQRLAVQLWPFRTLTWMFSICGLLALLLATVGLAGMVIHAVNQRRREFGVRVSMGATPSDLMLDVLQRSARLLLPGLIIGALLAAGAARLLQFAFYGVNVLDPTTYVAVALVEVLIVLMACIVPAFRAARVDPLVALRSL